MTKYYVADLATCVIVEADDAPEAQALGEIAIQRLRGRVGPIRVCRPATPDEVALHDNSCNWDAQR
jgi:hypothetical protein